jgi:L-lactate dehydrogenase complex protein LldE
MWGRFIVPTFIIIHIKNMQIGLFVPCYVNALFPEVGEATYKLLRNLNVDVCYPLNQTCCGQPMANAGFEEKAIPLARTFEEMFGKFDYVVAPSASCAAYIRVYYPHLLNSDHPCMSDKVMDIVEFLHDVLKVKSLPGHFPHVVSLHNSCHGVRELGLSSASELNIPKYNKIKDLLQMVDGIEIKEPDHVDECCGFGGMFSVEEPAVSVAMGEDKLNNHIATGAEYITGPDSSCLMHLQGIAKRMGKKIQFIHVAQIFAAGL